MIFSQGNHCGQILAGTKTQTRRRIKPEDATWGEDGKPLVVDDRYKVGQIIAVQPGRGKKAIAYIKITSIRCEPVADITDSDLLVEGGHTREGYFALWEKMYHVPPDTEWCRVLDFVLSKKRRREYE